MFSMFKPDWNTQNLEQARKRGTVRSKRKFTTLIKRG